MADSESVWRTSDPYTPPFVMVNVPPCKSSIFSFPSRALLAKSAMSRSRPAKAFLVRIAHDRNHESPLRANRYANVIEIVLNEILILDVAIDHRDGFKRFDTSLNKERHQAEFDAVLFRKLILFVPAQFLDGAHVAFIESRQDRCGVLRHHKLLRDLAAQRRHLFACEAPVTGWFSFARFNFFFRLRRGSGGQVRLAALLCRGQDVSFC